MQISYNKDWWLSTNKALEIQLDLDKVDSLFRIRLDIRRKGDYAGIDFELELFEKLYFGINFYDCRHWNYKKNRWYLPGEEAKEERKAW